MSYIHPDADTRHIIESAMNAKGLGTLGRMHDAARTLRMSTEEYARYVHRLEELRKNTSLTPVDETLVKLGSDVKYYKDGTKLIEKFGSNWAQVKLKQMKSDLTEVDLLKNVSGIMGDCDLRGTTIQDLSSLKRIGGTLTVDSASQLKDLSGIEKVLGSVMVHAKNEFCAREFLKSIGLNSAAIKGKIIPIIKNYL